MNLQERAKAFRKALDNVSAVADDQTAVKNKIIYFLWSGDGIAYYPGDKRREGDLLYKCRQEHVSQPGWNPSVTPALWEVIKEEHSGTIGDPIPYNPNMAVINGLYYTEEGILYKCIRDSGQPLYNSCASLVGIYFEVA